jgi:serine/threonine-protein kinase
VSASDPKDPLEQGNLFDVETMIVGDDAPTLIGEQLPAEALQGEQASPVEADAGASVITPPPQGVRAPTFLPVSTQPHSPKTPPSASSASAPIPPPSSQPTPSRSGAHSVQLQSETIGGRFRILALLGSGGMGNVYKVADTELDEVVALKMLHREAVGTPEWLERFRQEVKLARRVTHPNVARTFDIGEHGQEKFLTMEFIDGEALAGRLRRLKQLSLGETVEIVLPVCAGLAAAHAAGVVHRDLKPENVLISREGRVAITDFGIARQSVEAGGAEKTSGLLIGTPTYMAPEQVRHGTIDRRTDIYALGCMLYEMLTGHKPWTGNTTLAVAVARLFAPPPDPRAHRPDLMDAAAELVLACMALDPAGRPATAEDVARAMASLPVTTSTRRPLIDLARGTGLVSASSTTARGHQESTSVPGLPGGSVAEVNPGEHGLAVLPFRNGGDPADDHWADGFTDDLIETLSLLPKVKVRSRGAVLKFRGQTVDPRQVGRELEVQAVVEGSVRRSSGTVRVTARLVSVTDGFQIWAKRFDRADGDLLAIADEASQAIAQALVKPVAALPARADLNDPVALDLYLRARKSLRQFERGAAVEAAELAEQGLARVPDDPRLLAAQAIARARMWSMEADGNRSYEIAMSSARRAKELAPDMAETHTAVAVMLMAEMRMQEAIPELRAAMKRGPMLTEPRELAGKLLIELDRIPDGIAELERALALDPEMAACTVEIARAQALMGNWDRAWERLDDSTFLHVVGRARLLTWAGRVQETEALINRHESKFPLLARFRYITDEKAPRPATTLVGPRRARRDLFMLQLNAELAAGRGRHETALDSVVQAVGQGLFDIAWLDRCPILADVRADARFPELRRQVVARAEPILAALLS